MTEELTPRQQDILAVVVRQYVRGAQPIGSKAITDHPGVIVSSATVRNDLARLEKLGYLSHPHTSAGRVPTDQGYRYFVQQLMGSVQLPVSERRTIRHQFHQARPEIGQWMRLSAAILAKAGRSASLVTVPKAPASHFKHLELISIQESQVLLVLVLQGGIVRQQALVLTQPADQDWLSTTSARLNALLDGLNARDIEAKVPDLDPFDQQVASLAAATLAQYDTRETGRIYRAGVDKVLDQPEFSDPQGVRQILRILEEQTVLVQVLEEVLSAGGVQVFIGGEGRWSDLSEVSLVLARYGDTHQAAGVLGLIGPTRMSYARAISAVQYVGSLLNGLLHEFYLG